MKKRGYFSLLIVVLCSSFLIAAPIDIGSALELVVAEDVLASAQINSGSTVTTITQEQIKSYHAETTAELVGKALGVSAGSYGYVGGLATVTIRGISSAKNQVYLNGSLLSSAHDGTIDLSIIPLESIDRIEIIKNGPGNLGRTSAIGGIVNIITKQGMETATPFTINVENGSFLPLAYGNDNKVNWLGLVDSQRLELSYTNQDLVVNLGGIAARNQYVYPFGSEMLVRENAALTQGHGSVRYDTALSDQIDISSDALFVYKHLGVPGGHDWGLSAEDYQRDILLTTGQALAIDSPFEHMKSLDIGLTYNLAQTFYHSAYGDSTHTKHKGSLNGSGVWDVGENAALTTDLGYTLDYVDSTDLGKNTRQDVSVSAYGALYFADGTWGLYPGVQLRYVSDVKAFSPDASLGFVYLPTSQIELSGSFGYAENIPTFSDLYWPDEGYWVGNPNLITEKGMNAEVGVAFKEKSWSVEGSILAKNIFDQIASTGSTLENIEHVFYIGSEQEVTYRFNEMFGVEASYLYNKSFNLSGGNTFSNNVELPSVRKHSAKASLLFNHSKVSGILGAELLGNTDTLDSVFLLNLSLNTPITENIDLHFAIDNLLNTSYELTSGYPMPGMKIRLGGTFRF